MEKRSVHTNENITPLSSQGLHKNKISSEKTMRKTKKSLLIVHSNRGRFHPFRIQSNEVQETERLNWEGQSPSSVVR